MRENEIMEAREVASFLRLHLFTVHKLAREGKLPAFKIGSDWRFRRSSIEAWVLSKEKINHKEKSEKRMPKSKT
jgi:excisionase family DNA binding protein